jgi:hypothetical protein
LSKRAIRYRYLVTPGHGYLLVNTDEVLENEFIPTSYSFQRAGLTYLEEDCDMPAYIKLHNIDPLDIDTVYGELPLVLRRWSSNKTPTYERMKND